MYSFASLIDFFNKNKTAVDVVSSLSLSQVTLFIQLAIHLRGDILLVQSHTQDPNMAPHHLSPTIVDFLSAACAIGPDVVSGLWRMMGPVIWDADNDVYLLPLRNAVKMEEVFTMHGGPLGISSARSLYPAVKKCTTVGCSGTRFKLHTVSQYMLDSGVRLRVRCCGHSRVSTDCSTTESATYKVIVKGGFIGMVVLEGGVWFTRERKVIAERWWWKETEVAERRRRQARAPEAWRGNSLRIRLFGFGRNSESGVLTQSPAAE